MESLYPLPPQVWHTASGARTSTLSGHTNAIDALAFAPSAAADAAAGGELRKLAATRDAGRAAGGGAPPGEAAGAAGRGARYLASGARDMDVRVWDIDAAACVATLVSAPMLLCAAAARGVCDLAPVRGGCRLGTRAGSALSRFTRVGRYY